MPNLYAIGAVVIVILILLTWGMWEKATIAGYKTQIEKMNSEMAAAKAAHDEAIDALNVALEKSHADHQHDIDQKNGTLDGLAADLDRVRAKSKACSDVRVQAAPVPQGSPASDGGKPPAAVPGMDGSFKEITAIMKQCFAVAEYARVGHEWADDPAVSK